MRYFAVFVILLVFWPVSDVAAQSGRDTTPVNTVLCLKFAPPEAKYAYQSGPCPSDYQRATFTNTVSVPFVGVCVGKEGDSGFADEPNRPSDSDPTGQLSCDRGTLFAKNSIQTLGPPNSNSNGNSNTGSNTNSGSNSNTNTGGGSTQVQGGCETGFHEVGPLCVPNSPFNNSGGVAGAKTLQDLIVRVINILLFLAGIVAVIMAIIGGYYIMTAAGNPTQAANGRKTVVNAVIGLVIVVMSYVVIQVVVNFITK